MCIRDRHGAQCALALRPHAAGEHRLRRGRRAFLTGAGVAACGLAGWYLRQKGNAEKTAASGQDTPPAVSYTHLMSQLFKALSHKDLALVVQCAGGFVQNQDGRVLQKYPGNGDALLLSAGQLDACLLYTSTR